MTVVKIYVLLADKGAQNPHNGTLSLLNVGWTVTQLRRSMGPSVAVGAQPLLTGPQVVVVLIEAELAMCNKSLTLEIELLSDDGDIVEIPGPAGPRRCAWNSRSWCPVPRACPPVSRAGPRP